MEKLTFKKGFGYWDLTKYSYGGDFKRFAGTESGELIPGPVKCGNDLRVKLDNGTILITPAQACNMDFDTVLDMADKKGRTIV